MAIIRGRIVPDPPHKVALQEAFRTGEMDTTEAKRMAKRGLVVLAGDVRYVAGRTYVRLTPAGRKSAGVR